MPIAFTDHEHDESCVSLRPLGDDDGLFHLAEWQHAVTILRQANVPTVAFFVLRHLAELVLKRLVEDTTGSWPWGHDLGELLTRLDPQDPLRTSAEPYETAIRELVAAVGQIDRGGDAGRYAFGQTGEPSFDFDVCIVLDDLPDLANVLWEYCLERSGGDHAPGARPDPLPLDWERKNL